MKLNVRRVHMRAGFHKANRKTGSHPHRAGPERRNLGGNFALDEQASDFIIQHWFIAFEHQSRLQVVLHVFANRRQISKQDLFHYINGLLLSPDHGTLFKNTLSKERPHILAGKSTAKAKRTGLPSNCPAVGG